MTDKTLGAYERTTPDPDDMDGGVTAALIEKEAGGGALVTEDEVTAFGAAYSRVASGPDTVRDAMRRGVEAMLTTPRDGMDEKPLSWGTRGRWRALVQERDAAAARAEKAEQERDEARATKDMHKRRADEARARADAAESRPLTPDAITDEMVERARSAPIFDGRLSPTPGLVREMLTAALTETPARPEGAEELGELIGTWTATEDIAPAQLPTGSLATLADFLAEHGVRVVAEGDPR